MDVKALDWSVTDRTIAGFTKRLEHRRAQPGDRSDELFYELWIRYMRNIRNAKDEGKFLVAHNFGIPTEILYAMDIVPLHLQSCIGQAAALDLHSQCLSAAESFGLGPDLCSVNRLSTGFFLEGMWPRPDFFLGSDFACDGLTKNTDLVQSLFGCPVFHIERPYRCTPDAIQYVVGQLQDMIAFLEAQTQRRLSWDKLEEHLAYALRMADLHKQITELRKNVPTPLRSRKVPELELADFYFGGARDGVEFYQCVLEECQQRVAAGKGAIPKERFRLLSPYVFPTYCWNLVAWLEKEWGAINVHEVFFSHWRERQMSPGGPLEAIARKLWDHPIVGTQGGSLELVLGYLDEEVRDFKPDAMIWWAHRGCPHGCGSIYATSDQVHQRVGLPVLVVDTDYVDPGFEPEDRMRGRLNDFFATLELQRG